MLIKENRSLLHGSLDGRGAWGRMDTCVCVAESLCCPPETITTLLNSSTSSVTQSCPTFQPHGLQHTRPPCPSPTPGVYPNSCESVMPSNHLIFCHPLLLLPSILLSIRVFSSKSSGQSIGVSALASVLPMNIQNWLPLGGTGWISLQCKGLSRVFSNTTIQNHQLIGSQLPL